MREDQEDLSAIKDRVNEPEITYEIRNDELVVQAIKIGHRSDVYKQK
jgi:mRNA-degrading endonuclease RelE of RelBE toxin-antitoxin system